jgi:hypothetical protein
MTDLIPYQQRLLQDSVLPADTTDDMLITMWLHDKSAGTQEEYTRDIQLFRAQVA